MLRFSVIASVLVIGFSASAGAAEPTDADKRLIERGRYLAKIAGCNDCHTAGYMETGGDVPESTWLTGSDLGWYGPWGTTYAINLRLYMQDLTEEEWIERAESLQTRPPMPWFAIRDMDDHDVRALYQFVRSLGEPGEPAPEYIPPGEEPPMPYAKFPGVPLQ